MGGHAVVQFIQISGVGRLYFARNVLSFSSDNSRFLYGIFPGLNFFGGICRVLVGVADGVKCPCKDRTSLHEWISCCFDT